MILNILYDPKIMQLVGIELNPGPITSTQFSDIVTFQDEDDKPGLD